MCVYWILYSVAMASFVSSGWKHISRTGTVLLTKILSNVFCFVYNNTSPSRPPDANMPFFYCLIFGYNVSLCTSSIKNTYSCWDATNAFDVFIDICTGVFLVFRSSFVYFDTTSITTTRDGFSIVIALKLASNFIFAYKERTFRLPWKLQLSDHQEIHI